MQNQKEFRSSHHGIIERFQSNTNILQRNSAFLLMTRDVIELILLKLDLSERMRIAQTCKLMLAIVDSDKLWREQCLQENMQLTSDIVSYKEYYKKSKAISETKFYYIIGNRIKIREPSFFDRNGERRLKNIPLNKFIDSFPKEGSVKVFKNEGEAFHYVHDVDEDISPEIRDSREKSSFKFSPGIFKVNLRSNARLVSKQKILRHRPNATRWPSWGASDDLDKYDRYLEKNPNVKNYLVNYFEMNVSHIKKILSVRTVDDFHTVDFCKIENVKTCLIS